MIEDTLSEIHDLHRFLTIVQNINVGLVILNKSFIVRVWNGFMENNSGISGSKIIGKCLFDFFPEIQTSWLKEKVYESLQLETTIFSSWEQHTEVFNFQNNRPFTGSSTEMIKNFTILPINSLSGKPDEVCIIIYDVTDEACSKQALQGANARLHELSITDRLTNIYNRGYWEECLKQQFRIFMRTKVPVTLLMFDIDHFKNINDTYGHPAGDQVLRDVSAILKKIVRNSDIAGRYGGEEFTILLLDANREASYYVAERLRKAVESHTVHYQNLEINFTISIGLCTLSDVTSSPQEWLVKTDNSLYFSKEHGRNRTTQYGLNDTEETMNIEIKKEPTKSSS
ncbi:MAG: diguanylate cyclase [Succinivibrionaceae bacterium]|nr:diguanylate cyclase [Succinivibrionaceae bacterium]